MCKFVVPLEMCFRSAKQDIAKHAFDRRLVGHLGRITLPFTEGPILRRQEEKGKGEGEEEGKGEGEEYEAFLRLGPFGYYLACGPAGCEGEEHATMHRYALPRSIDPADVDTSMAALLLSLPATLSPPTPPPTCLGDAGKEEFGGEGEEGLDAVVLDKNSVGLFVQRGSVRAYLPVGADPRAVDAATAEDWLLARGKRVRGTPAPPGGETGGGGKGTAKARTKASKEKAVRRPAASGYTVFMQEKVPAYKALHPDATHKEAFGAVAGEWKAMEAEDKDAFKNKAAAMNRSRTEDPGAPENGGAALSPSKEGGKKEKKRRAAPSAFNLFMREKVPAYKRANPEAAHKEAFGAVAGEWKGMGADAKAAFQNMAAAARGSGGAAEGEGAGEGDGEEGRARMTLKELRAQLRARGLPVSGNKADLVRRLNGTAAMSA